MKIKRHSVKNFRNITELELPFDGGVTVISGKNGQGKTNLLESIWLLTGARSFRTNLDEYLIKKGCAFSIIDSDFFSQGRDNNFRMTISDKGRLISQNGGTPQKAAAMAGTFICVAFAPSQMEIVKGSPEKRRKFIDTALGQLYPTYITSLKKYNRVLFQRNSLLKDCYSVSAALDMLDVFDLSLSEAAVSITEHRRAFVQRLLPYAQEYYRKISDDGEQMSFYYDSAMFGTEKPDIGQAKQELLKCRADDIRAGFSTKGPHRDELVIINDGADARAFASQGQLRSTVLAMKLSEAKLFEEIAEERPLLLLDDVLSELDSERQNFLIECIKDEQAIVTGCDETSISQKTNCTIYKISEGAIAE